MVRTCQCVAMMTLLLALGWAEPGYASETEIGDGYAIDCARMARSVADKERSGPDAVAICSSALELENLKLHDLVATYVNRGILYMAGHGFTDALRDFNAALALNPNNGEAYLNRGAVLVNEQHYAEGISDIDHGLQLNPSEPERGYFNRGLAHEKMNQIRDAYDDYQMALQLKPSWTLVQTTLTRFTVVSKPTEQ